MIASIAADRALQQILRLLPTLSTILSRCTRKKITSFVLHAHADAVEIVHSQQSGSPPTVHAAANVFQRFCYENKDALSAGIIVAGWDKEINLFTHVRNLSPDLADADYSTCIRLLRVGLPS